jgi:FkbM family methyltransferase
MPRPTTAEVVASILEPYSTTVLDIGARGGVGDAWFRLAPLAAVVGFDADPAECERLNWRVPPSRRERYLPLALGAVAGTTTFYQTRGPGSSSIYPPDQDLAERYLYLYDHAEIGWELLSVTTLDAWARAEGDPEVSFMKLDTQGSELDILRGGKRTLRSCLGLELEVEFAPLYRGQPLFADLDTYLRGLGFELWHLDNLVHSPERRSAARPPTTIADCDDQIETSRAGKGRLLWGHALYFRDYRGVLSADSSSRRALILAALLDAAGDWVAAARCIEGALALSDPLLSPEHAAALRKHLEALKREA